jgi:hypothetical protein
MENKKVPCDLCKKSFINVLLHKLKTHKIVQCIGCEKWVSIEKVIGECGGKNTCYTCYECFGYSE